MTTKIQKLSSLGVASVLLGSVLAPVVASAATANTNATTVTVAVDSVISISSANSVSFTITPSLTGAVSSDSDVVTVNTNDAGGYSLTLGMNSGAATLTGSNGGSFSAVDGSVESPAELSPGEWGFALNKGTLGLGTLTEGTWENGFDTSYTAESSNSSSSSVWAAVPASSASAVQIRKTSAPGQTSATTVWFAANANTTQNQGTYTGNIKYTATTNGL